ncbi:MULTISPECIES: hypothetical protein [Streptomyces]|uniref:hypothetical protein n=1 Tax=Streptomyces TaxID=1883 RepID=UPI0004BD7737|nr:MULTISPECIES: hypothetical protein [Streptomyces]KOG83225.1 hypothetical protein ADK33_06425 [Streptomyces griseus subsp. rhodochrous]KOU06530.1 hypothetical protein ADK88_14335 [Streptomyces sp. NRRL F-2295]
MPAPTHPKSPGPPAGGVSIRLPWWAVALPAAAFAVLLTMILSPAQAHAATGAPVLGQLVEYTLQLLFR